MQHYPARRADLEKRLDAMVCLLGPGFPVSRPPTRIIHESETRHSERSEESPGWRDIMCAWPPKRTGFAGGSLAGSG